MTLEQLERKRKSNREYAARYRAKNLEKAKAYMNAHMRSAYKKSPEKYREKTYAWVKENPVKAAAAYAKWSTSDKGKLSSCRRKLAARLGVFARDVPDELVAAKFAQLKVIRLVRDLG